VLRTANSRSIGGRLLSLPRFNAELAEFERIAAAQSGPLIARDTFVANMAIKLDQVRSELGSLKQQIEKIGVNISELREDAERNDRFSVFQESQQRSKAEKLDSLSRQFLSMQKRLDCIEGSRSGDYHAFTSFEAISKKMIELDSLQREFRGVHRNLKISAGLFCGSVFLWLAALVT
jgi:chromosome segregation ATPase